MNRALCCAVRYCVADRPYESELVAGHREDAEVLEAGLQCIQREVLRRRASERRHVDDEDDAAAVQRPVERLGTVHVVDLVVVDRPVACQRVVAQHLATHAHRQHFRKAEKLPSI